MGATKINGLSARERLYGAPMNKFLFVLLPLVVTPAYGQPPEGRCSLRVSVTDRSGQPRDIPVTVQAADGEHAVARVSPGVYEICDLGLAAVDILVGKGNACAVVLKNVMATLGVTLDRRVIFEPCGREYMAEAICRRLLRVTDATSHRAVPNPIFEFDGKQVRGDQYGRMMLTPRFGETIHGLIVREGYTPASVSLECKARPTSHEDEESEVGVPISRLP